MTKHTLVNMVDQAYEAKHRANNDDFRAHLGGSLIGRKCDRDLWYSFRWTAKGSFNGRMLRLFDRGHKEEFRFVEFLTGAGINIRAYSERLLYHPESDSYATEAWDVDLSTMGADRAMCDDVTNSAVHIERAERQGIRMKQWRIKDVLGHFGGSLDGLADAPFDIPANTFEWSNAGPIGAGVEFLLEFKTHNTKSFTKLVVEGVRKAKPEHYAQMQVYMKKRELIFAVYVAVNKNDDDLHIEIVAFDEEHANDMFARAERIITRRTPPDRIGNSPSWFDCKICSHQKTCHYGEPMNKSCRSCVFSTPVDGGDWKCEKFGGTIPVDFIPEGCGEYKMITD